MNPNVLFPLLVVALLMVHVSADVRGLISPNFFNDMLKHRNSVGCRGNDFYNYEAFITAANSFPGFGTTGDLNTQKRELAAFFGQTSHETTGGWAAAPDGPYTWGYCFTDEKDRTDPRYYGRGPIQLTHDYNYRQAGNALGVDLLNNPDLVSRDSVISFKSAIWFWMTAQGNKPSSHDVITGRWGPSDGDRAANRYPGYGVITNIINGGMECGKGSPTVSRDSFYKRYCDMFGVNYGDNISCQDQRPFA